MASADGDNVLILPVITSLPIPCERVLKQAIAADLDQVLVIGYTQSGEFYFAGSEADGPKNVWLCEMAKHKLMAITIEAEDESD